MSERPVAESLARIGGVFSKAESDGGLLGFLAVMRSVTVLSAPKKPGSSTKSSILRASCRRLRRPNRADLEKDIDSTTRPIYTPRMTALTAAMGPSAPSPQTVSRNGSGRQVPRTNSRCSPPTTIKEERFTSPARTSQALISATATSAASIKTGMNLAISGIELPRRLRHRSRWNDFPR